VAPILVVDDDDGLPYEGYFTAALNGLGRDHDVWTVQSEGSPPATTLMHHDIVIWFTGSDTSTTLTSTDQANLATYLDAGGKLFVTGQGIGSDIQTAPFFSDYLHATHIDDDTNTYLLTGHDILSDVDATISGGDGANNQDFPSEIGMGSGAVGLYDYDGSYTWGALRWEGAYRLVYCSFGYEAINAASSRTAVMDAVLTWLETGVAPGPSKRLWIPAILRQSMSSSTAVAAPTVAPPSSSTHGRTARLRNG
jgi:hypothetical protein